MNKLIELLQHQDLVWQGSTEVPQHHAFPTGYGELNQHLDGGFPKGVTEIQSASGLGELRLLLPLLKKAVAEHRLIALVSPYGTVCAEALVEQGIALEQVLLIYPKDQQDGLWAAEQCLRSGACHSVVTWTDKALEVHQVKRLQVASDEGNCLQFILRTGKGESLSLPFDLSLSLKPDAQGLIARINKRKRGWPSTSFNISMVKYWPALTQQPMPDNLIPFPQVKAG